MTYKKAVVRLSNCDLINLLALLIRLTFYKNDYSRQRPVVGMKIKIDAFLCTCFILENILRKT